MSLKPGQRQPFKEKFVQIYEAFFEGRDPSLVNPNFWDELFLLKVNAEFIEKQFESCSAEQLLRLKETLNAIFHHSVAALRSEHRIRVVNALQTLCALVRGVFRKAPQQGSCGFDVINLLIGFDAAEQTMQDLVDLLCAFLSGDAFYSHNLKLMVLRFLLVLVTATENVSNNTLLEYIMMNSIFESIIQLLADPVARQHCGYDAVLLLTVLVNYRKYESTNPYIVKLSIVDNELALNGYGLVVSSKLAEFNRKFCQQIQEPQTGLFSTVTSLVGTMFLADETVTFTKDPERSDDSVLLALYEAIHLNRNFISVLTNSQSESCANPSSSHSSVPPSPSVDSKDVPSVDGSNALFEPPSNLLVTFLEFTSIVMQKTKEDWSANTTKLCFIILTCVTEDQFANSVMHDDNLVFKVQIHFMPMRHRKILSSKDTPSRPLASALLDLCTEFICSHMNKNIQLDLYQRCIGVVHRMLCYQKRCRVRLQYDWKDLWTALISLLKFLQVNESDLIKKVNVFALASQVVNIFNVFITFGDTFLPSPSAYDELYYEIVRMHQVFDNMYSMALRYTSGDGQWKESAAKLTNHLVNIRAISNHFTPKIESWASMQNLSSLTEEQVLEVVRCNYDTLTLKLHDGLDQYERYAEKPKETGFFTSMLRNVVSEFRSRISVDILGHEAILKEFSSIT